MPLPSDADYISPAPQHVQANSKLFKKFLSMNEDPYASLTYRPNIIKAIEDEIADLPPGK
jgi:hypothetical protein